jgi:cell division septum initiation protein DivIVA
VDVHEKLDELTAALESARAMPMSASCIVNRGEILALIDDVRELLPEEFRHAQMLLEDRDAVVEEGRREVAKLMEEAAARQAALVSETDVRVVADREAEEIRQAAVREAEEMRREVDDYVDAKLANFEVVLDRTLAAVHRGREKLRGHHDLEGYEDAANDEPMPS